MKILDRYLLTTFLQTLGTVFIILYFIFILQAVWLFIAELAGKDLDIMLVAKFLLFYSPKMIPLVLPLSILLASIMSFGNLAENYEFAAMKSSGISLQRAMKVLTYFILFLSVIAFVFANNVIPAAEYKFINLRRDIVQTKPAMAIAEGQFSDIGEYNIKVDKKTGEKGEKLENITIHKKSFQAGGSNVVIKAKNGILVNNEESSMLQMILFNGNYYENIIPKKYEERKKVPFIKASFKKDIINIDLSKLNTVQDEADITNTNAMLNVSELTYTLDSLHKNLEKDVVSFADNAYQRTGINSFGKMTALEKKEEKKQDSIVPNLLSLFSNSEKAKVLNIAVSNIQGTKYSIDGTNTDLEEKQKNINNHWLALYEKFVIAYACILMFFIGAPLGAIIRKGGLGLPIVFATLIFISFHFINTFGKKLAQENGIPAFLGSWMSSFVLTPLAILLTYRATNDIGLINMDAVFAPISKFFRKLFKSKNNKVLEFKNHIVDLTAISIDLEDSDYQKYSNLDNTTLKGIVKNATQFGYSAIQRLKVLKILETRGVTQEELLLSNQLYNTDYLKLTHYIAIYKKQTNFVLTFYVLAIIFSILSNFPSIIIIILALINLILLYTFIYKSGQTLSEIAIINNNTNRFANIYLSLFIGFPFFIFIYLYNKIQLKEVLAEFNK